MSNLQNGEVEVRAVIIYLCKKGMAPKEIHEDSMKTLRNESLSYITVKKWAAEFKRVCVCVCVCVCVRERERESIEDDVRSGRPKDDTTDENVEIVHNLIMCDRRRDLRSIASEVGISFGAV